MIKRLVAQHDDSLTARVIKSTPILYIEGGNDELDRPAYVRAGSSLARVNNQIAVIQDDANFIALIDPATCLAQAISLPVGLDQRRQFDDTRGNKHYKLDLEACVAATNQGEDVLVVFGSGATKLREKILTVRGWNNPEPLISIHEASEFYSVLRATKEFAGSELNIEGAIIIDEILRLFCRGNGTVSNGLYPLDASCDISWKHLWEYLNKPNEIEVPPLSNIIQYELGSLQDAPLTFTDATPGSGAILFTATAEASTNVINDGEVFGSAIGVIDKHDRVRWTRLVDSNNRIFLGKAEGLLLSEEIIDKIYVVIDQDDPTLASELCEIELEGGWFS